MPSKTIATTPQGSKNTKNSSSEVHPAKERLSAVKALPAKPKGPANGSILSFFKPEGLFIQDLPKKTLLTSTPKTVQNEPLPVDLKGGLNAQDVTDGAERYNEKCGASKRRKLSHSTDREINAQWSPSQTAINPREAVGVPLNLATTETKNNSKAKKPQRPKGPFLDETDSEGDDDTTTPLSIDFSAKEIHTTIQTEDDADFDDRYAERAMTVKEEKNDEGGLITPTSLEPPSLNRDETSYTEGNDGFEGFEGLDDFDDEYAEGDENVEKRWMREQRKLEMEEGGFEGDPEDGEFDPIKDEEFEEKSSGFETSHSTRDTTATCPLCSAILNGLSDQEASVHVNACLDGNPIPLPIPQSKLEPATKNEDKSEIAPSAKYRRPVRAAKPGQENPFMLGTANGTSSAFSKLMSNHAEDEAWATAAAAEHAARGKPAYQRTCPFYKILPGFFTCVDAFRYGAVQGCNAYFLSHFHSDHYIGLTSTWCHGPIYCSHITANLVKQQLRVDPKWVVDLEWEQKTELPGTQGVSVTMIPANHCPGSSIYLFEKVVRKGLAPKVQRVLHCGDFRACPAHVEHPLLKPDVMDAITGKTQQQKIDVCYLDTTYLNPKYAFPSQEDVIQACADMCVSLNKTEVDDKDGREQMKKERAGSSMANFVRVDSKDEGCEGEPADDAAEPSKPAKKNRGQLLVIVGTYSIGKERICLGIAKALDSKIYAPPGKQRICAALEDPELNARLTSDPRKAQVHMTPLFEIRAETLGDYLTEYRDRFSRAVGFRPSGWNYRPPGSRFTESPAVGTVLYSENWKSGYSMRNLAPQRGSTSRASCFGVPYSEHSSFRELTMFCCALRIDKIVPTVNVGSAKSREKMKLWCDRWAIERKKNGLFKATSGGENGAPLKSEWFPGKGTMELRTNL